MESEQRMIDYGSAGVFTTLTGSEASLFEGLPDDPVEICRPVHGLVIQPTEAEKLDLPETRFIENQLRPVQGIVDALIALDPSPLVAPREPEHRVVGTCRHFALLACALLRRRGIESRVRCGFATYFQPGQGLDHWITEFRTADERGWIRVDAELLDGEILAEPERLRPDEFMSGGEAWLAFRRGEIDPDCFGVYGSTNFGAAEIRGNAVKDLAAMNKVEMLPWDEWGQMTAAYKGETGRDYDALLDDLAQTCSRDDPAEVASLYTNGDLRVPVELIETPQPHG